MIATFFNKTNPNVTLSLFVLLVFSCVFSLFTMPLEDFRMVLERGVVHFLTSAFLLYMLIFTIKNYKLTLKNSYAGLFFVFIFSIFPIIPEINYSIFSAIALSFSFFKIYGLHNYPKTQKNIFDSGFWIGVATLFHFWSFLFLALLLFSLIKNKKGNLKNILSGGIGFIVPLFLFFTYHFYFDSLSLLYNIVIKNFDSFSFSPYLKYPTIVSTVFSLLCFLGAFIFITPKASVISKKFYLVWNLLVVHFIISCIIIGLSLEKIAFGILLLSFPLSIIFTIFLQNISIKLKNGMLFTFLLVVVFQILYLFNL